MPKSTHSDEDQRYDPVARRYEDRFDPQHAPKDLSEAENQSDFDPERTPDTDLAARERNSSRNENGFYTPDDTEPASGGRFSSKQKTIGGTIVGVIIALVLGIASFSPFGMLIHLKEAVSDWSDRFNSAAYHTRMKSVMKERYFGDRNCRGIKLKCRLVPEKIPKIELDDMRRNGLDPKLDKRGRLVSMANPDRPGQRVTARNFERVYANNPNFAAAIHQSSISPRAITWRGPQALKKMINVLKINRKAPLGDTDDRDRLRTEMRTTMYTDENAPDRYRMSSGVEVTEGDSAAQDDKIRESIDELDDSIGDQAAQIQAEAVENGPPANSVVDSGMSAENAAEKITKGSLSGAIKGPLGFLDSACMVRRMGVTLSTAIKLYQARALIKYAAIFMTIADSAKAGDVSAAQMSYLGTILMRESTQDSTKGLTVSDSALVTLVNQGKVRNYGSAKRFTNGNTYTRTIDRFINTLGGGASADTCKHVNSWYGQLGIVISGVGSCIFTAGGTCVAGAIKGGALGIGLALIVGQLTPTLVHLLAGTVAPDPENDPEGGYGAGNAIASGMGALGLSSVGRANGMAPMTTAEYAAISQEINQTSAYLAKVESINNPGLFNPDNPNSMSHQLAVAYGPSFLALQSGGINGIFTGFASLIGSTLSSIPSSLNSLFKPADAATDKYRGDLCTDPAYKEMGLQTDAFCNVIHAMDPSTLDNPKYEPQKVVDYMIEHEHVNTSTADPKSDDFSEFMEVCVDGDQPIMPDEPTDDVCTDKDEKYTYFRLFVMDNNIVTSLEQHANGTFGHGEAINDSDSSSPTDITIATYNILHGHNHADKSRDIGGCSRNPVPGDPNCIKTRTERQVRIITGQADNPQFDIFGTQETSSEQYNLLKNSLDGYDSFPTNTSRMNNQQDGAVSIFWNTNKLTMFDSGKAPGVSNVVRGPLSPNGNVTIPWVGLQTTSGQKMYVMSIHYPISAFGGDRATLLKASQLARDWVQSKASKDTPVFIVGDFNDRLPQDITYCAFTRGGLMQNVYDMANNVDPSKQCPTNKDIGIDHLYATPMSGMSASKWVHASKSGIYGQASDHTPVYATITFSPNKAGWTWPIQTPVHAGPCFGGPRGHAGMDINTVSGSNPALAANAGTVHQVGSGGAAGNYVMIKTADGYYYAYQHLKSISVKEGQQVSSGQKVGIVGLTGNLGVASTTKGHLHMTVSKQPTLGSYGNIGNMLDPMDFLPKNAPGGYKCYVG